MKFVMSQGDMDLLNFACAKVDFKCLRLEKLWRVSRIIWSPVTIALGGTNYIHRNLRIHYHQLVDEISYQLIKKIKHSILYF